MSSPLSQVTDIWTRMPMSGRMMTIAAALATIGMIAGIIYYGSQPDYRVLFSDLKPEEAQTIVEKLKTGSVQYSLSNGGTTISVPADRVPELRLQMAGEGVLTGGHVGFDIFDKTNFGATDFAQKVNYRRAIEGELSKTLEAMDELEAVRVHITPKKESVFTEKEEGAKASVMVRVKQGKELSSERTEAIVSLISSSVEGLDAGSVSVMDTRGRLLTAGNGKASGTAGEAGAFNAQLEAKRKYENETAARVVSLLEPIAGEGRVRADVSSDVDFSQVEQTEEKYTPQSQIVRSQQTLQESHNVTSANGAQPAGGVAGARSNNPATAVPTPAPQVSQNGDQRTTSTVNYEMDKTTRRTIGGGGRVNRLTVSVLVDHKTVNDITVARTNDELQQIQQLVTAAVGVDTNRGDTVVVQTMPFDRPSELEAVKPSWLDNNKPFLVSIAKYAAMVVIALLVLFFVIRPARKALKVAFAAPSGMPQLGAGQMRRADDVDPHTMMTVAEMEAQMHSGSLGGDASHISHTAQRAESIRKNLVDQTLAQPELVAGTLRGWLRESN
jgi:flagellar M-ring protein FliF